MQKKKKKINSNICNDSWDEHIGVSLKKTSINL